MAGDSRGQALGMVGGLGTFNRNGLGARSARRTSMNAASRETVRLMCRCLTEMWLVVRGCVCGRSIWVSARISWARCLPMRRSTTFGRRGLIPERRSSVIGAAPYRAWPSAMNWGSWPGISWWERCRQHFLTASAPGKMFRACIRVAGRRDQGGCLPVRDLLGRSDLANAPQSAPALRPETTSRASVQPRSDGRRRSMAVPPF
jgi:hypothetical protein